MKTKNWLHANAGVPFTALAMMALVATSVGCSKKKANPDNLNDFRGIWARQDTMQRYRSYNGNEGMNSRDFCLEVNQDPGRFGIRDNQDLYIVALNIQGDGNVLMYDVGGAYSQRVSAKAGSSIRTFQAGQVDAEGNYRGVRGMDETDSEEAHLKIDSLGMLIVTTGQFSEEQAVAYMRTDEKELQGFVSTVESCSLSKNSGDNGDYRRNSDKNPIPDDRGNGQWGQEEDRQNGQGSGRDRNGNPGGYDDYNGGGGGYGNQGGYGGQPQGNGRSNEGGGYGYQGGYGNGGGQQGNYGGPQGGGYGGGQPGGYSQGGNRGRNGGGGYGNQGGYGGGGQQGNYGGGNSSRNR